MRVLKERQESTDETALIATWKEPANVGVFMFSRPAFAAGCGEIPSEIYTVLAPKKVGPAISISGTLNFFGNYHRVALIYLGFLSTSAGREGIMKSPISMHLFT